LKRLAAEGVRFNVIQHWSEWFIPVWGWGEKNLVRDPRVVAAKKAMNLDDLGIDRDIPVYSDWNKHLHARRAYYEGRLTKAVQDGRPRPQFL
jgi:hypothetical protein